MLKNLLLVLYTSIIFYSCTSEKPVRLLNPGNIRSQYFSVQPDRDTVLTGLRGGDFSISKGTFPGADPVQIEIKEVYNPAEFLIAGLVTESNGELLESGGMIYFNATRKGKKLDPKKPIDVSIPAHYVNKEMKLFKGEELPDGRINWVDPEEIPSLSDEPPVVDTGKIIFETQCKSCHGLFTDGTGPKLAWVETRNTREDLIRFIRNPAFELSKSTYFHCLLEKYKSMMVPFPQLTDQEISAVLDYIKKEEVARPDLRNMDETKAFLDSCTTNTSWCTATVYVDTTEENSYHGNIDPFPQEATKDDTAEALYKDPKPLELAQRSGLSDKVSTEGRYNFKINTLGWFNVDAFYRGLEGTDIVDLFIKTDFNDEMDIHVFFPEKKLLTVGVYHKDDSLYHFQKFKGQIPLYLNDEAVALALTSAGEKIYYGITKFSISRKQVIDIKVKETTKGEFERAFRDLKLDGIDLDVITKKRITTTFPCSDSLRNRDIEPYNGMPE